MRFLRTICSTNCIFFKYGPPKTITYSGQLDFAVMTSCVFTTKISKIAITSRVIIHIYHLVRSAILLRMTGLQITSFIILYFESHSTYLLDEKKICSNFTEPNEIVGLVQEMSLLPQALDGDCILVMQWLLERSSYRKLCASSAIVVLICTYIQNVHFENLKARTTVPNLFMVENSITEELFFVLPKKLFLSIRNALTRDTFVEYVHKQRSGVSIWFQFSDDYQFRIFTKECGQIITQNNIDIGTRQTGCLNSTKQLANNRSTSLAPMNNRQIWLNLNNSRFPANTYKFNNN